MKAYQRISKKSISLQEIPNLLPLMKITPKVNKENIQVTQVHGSMEGKKILEKVSTINEDKAQKEQAKKERKYKQQQQIEAFFKCKEECTCGKNVCAATKLQECPCCHVLKSTCSKASCQGEIGPKKSLQFESDEDDIEYDDADDDLSDADKVTDEELTSEYGERNSGDDHQDDLKQGDCVKVLCIGNWRWIWWRNRNKPLRR